MKDWWFDLVPLRPKHGPGNFRCGDNHYSAAHLHPDEKRVIVIAGGADYLINPYTKALEGHTFQNISFSRKISDLQIVVFGNHIRFWAEGKDGRRWTTPRVSWDGIEVVGVVESVLTGKCYSALDEMWHEFGLDLVSGEMRGQTFEVDFRQVRAVEVKK